MKFLIRKLGAFIVICILLLSALTAVVFWDELTEGQFFKAGLRTMEGGQPPPALTEYAVIVYWTTWCNICEAEIPHLKELDARDNVTVIAINVGESQKTVEKYLEKMGIEYTVLLGAETTPSGKVPYSILFQGGQQVEYFAGGVPKRWDDYFDN